MTGDCGGEEARDEELQEDTVEEFIEYRPYNRGRKWGPYCSLCQRWADEPHLRGSKRAPRG